jgi:hypothetical protein
MATTDTTKGGTMEKVTDINGNEITVNTVIRYAGRRRMYVVTHIDCTGTLQAIALSGAFSGSAPHPHGNQVEVVTAPIAFTGKKARYLCNRYNQAVR